MLRFVIVFLSATIHVLANDSLKVDKRDLSNYHYRNKIILVDDYNKQDYVDAGIYNYNENDIENKQFSDSKLYKKPSRRIFEWFSKFFRTTTPKPIYSTIATTESSYEKDLKERIFLKEIYNNLTEVVTKMSDIHKHVTNLIKQREANTGVTKGKRSLQQQNRNKHHNLVKRDVTPKSTTTSHVDINNEENKLINNTKYSSEVTVNITSTECPCGNINNTSGRRSLSSYTSSEVKLKLLLYLKESFLEINNKILSLKDIKEAFSDDYSFKIGYIIANIDALEINISNLKKNMEKNKEMWEDKTILELFDTLKVSNQAISGLTESLKMYIDKLASYDAQKI